MQKGEIINKGIDYTVKTLGNVCALNYVSQASLNKLGEYLGRLVTRFPAAYNPFIGGVAISILGDLAEKGLAVLLKQSPNIKFFAQVLVRPLLCAGIFAAATAFTGGAALIPAAIAGAKFGAFLLLADKVSKVAVIILRFIAAFVIHMSTLFTDCCSEKLSEKIITIAKFFAPANYNLFY